MRVALVTNGLGYGGAERIVEALAHGLRSGGDEVCVVATTRDGPVGAALRQAGVPVTILGIAGPLDVRVPFKLARVVRRFNAQIVHSHLAVADIATAAAAPMLGGARLVSTAHNPGVELGRLKKHLWHRALPHFHRVLAVSEPVAAGLPDSVHAQILRPSLVSIPKALPSRVEARQRLGLPKTGLVIMGVGRLAAVKGFDVLVAALPLLSTEGVHAVIIGDGPEAQRLERLSRTPRPSDGRAANVTFVPGREDAGDLVAAADLVVCPSRSEGFPQVPLHAMAAGVPVVATAVGGTPEIVVNGRTGLLVRPEDPAALAGAMDRLLGSAESTRMGAAGRQRLLDESLTREAMIRRTRSVYDAVL